MKRVSFYSALYLCLFAFLFGAAYAEEQPKLPQNKDKFGGLSMGIGLSLTHDLGWNDRVSKAEIIKDVVRVEQEQNDIARIMLEMHYFFTPNVRLFGLDQYYWGHGPFVGIQPGKDKIIDAIGLGWMIGFRNSSPALDPVTKRPVPTWAETSWNFGIGFVVDPTSKILGDGFVANAPPPPGETTVRLKETSQGGIMFITSFSFN